MSRFALICSLVFGLSASSWVSTADAQFAKAPPVTGPSADRIVAMSTSDVTVAPDMRIAPRRMLDRSAVRAALVKARQANLAAFRAYQAKGVFPSNTHSAKKLNVWLDAAGNLCAAATIIKMSGQDALVTKTAEQNNFIRLADVTQGPLMDWILTSGFTQAEIAMIQEPFMPVDREPSMAAPIVVDAKLRKAEDARLRATYKRVDKALVKNQRASLDAAVDRLMKNQSLAWSLLTAQSARG
jgi:hypothetical protein